MRRTLAELARLLASPPVGPDVIVTGAAIDSRACRPGDLFVAIRGERTDGHDHLADAAAHGAVAALVAREVPHPLPQLLVADPVAALQRLAASERARSADRLVGITGSIAKTTTKEFLAALLATTFRTGCTAGSRNSQASFPAELCSRPDDLEWFVAELGMSHAGELDRLGAVAQPDALLYTVIAPVHLEYFASIEAIAEAKAELIPHLARDGVLVLNAADHRVARLAGRFGGRIVRYGAPGASDLWLDDFQGHGLLGASFTLRGRDVAIQVEWSMAGRHQAANLVAAGACALALGVKAEHITPCAATLRPAPRRGEVHALPSGITLVDDSYNASPVAVTRLLELLAATEGRRVAVLGEMLELGRDSLALHREVGLVAGGAADVVVAIGGPPAAALADAAAGAETHAVDDVAAALPLLAGLLRTGDVVLVKGSRGIGLDRLVDALRGGAR
jgi:UDP-N-acetylmuramoyl-tripeptide--D-alanyl-D-alanine ligase